jgi:hypothetical protein
MGKKKVVVELNWFVVCLQKTISKMVGGFSTREEAEAMRSNLESYAVSIDRVHVLKKKPLMVIDKVNFEKMFKGIHMYEFKLDRWAKEKMEVSNDVA